MGLALCSPDSACVTEQMCLRCSASSVTDSSAVKHTVIRYVCSFSRWSRAIAFFMRAAASVNSIVTYSLRSLRCSVNLLSSTRALSLPTIAARNDVDGRPLRGALDPAQTEHGHGSHSEPAALISGRGFSAICLSSTALQCSGQLVTGSACGAGVCEAQSDQSRGCSIMRGLPAMQSRHTLAVEMHPVASHPTLWVHIDLLPGRSHSLTRLESNR